MRHGIGEEEPAEEVRHRVDPIHWNAPCVVLEVRRPNCEDRCPTEGEASMATSVLVLLLTAALMPTAVQAQATRDTPPPAIQNARRARELRALVASGAATKETYVELANLDVLQNRLDDAVAELRAAAQLEPGVAEVQHMVATMAWQHASRDLTDPDGRLLFIREAVALEDRALALKRDYAEAM